LGSAGLAFRGFRIQIQILLKRIPRE
jgi:hypothetical protein